MVRSLLVALFCLFGIASHGQDNGTYLFTLQKDGDFEKIELEPNDDDVLGFDEEGHIVAVPRAELLSEHSHAWSTITSKPTTLSGFGITDGLTAATAASTYAPISHSHAWSSITSKPTTLSGFGITDGLTAADAASTYAPLSHSHAWSTITSKPTTLSGFGITDGLTAADAASTYQPTDAFLSDIAALTDPDADRILFWDDSAGHLVWLNLGSGLSISGTTITASGGGGSGTFTDTVTSEASNASTTPLAAFNARNTNPATADIDEFDGVNTEVNVSGAYNYTAAYFNGSTSVERTWSTWLEATNGFTRWHLGQKDTTSGRFRVLDFGTSTRIELNGATNPITLALGNLDDGEVINCELHYNPSNGVLSIGNSSAIQVNVSTGAVTFSHGNGIAFGYGPSAGGAVTQTGSRTNGVTLNRVCGTITTNSTSLAAGSSAEFTVTNSSVGARDTVQAVLASGNVTTSAVFVTGVAAGSFKLTVRNFHGSTAETGALAINFTILKGTNN